MRDLQLDSSKEGDVLFDEAQLTTASRRYLSNRNVKGLWYQAIMFDGAAATPHIRPVHWTMPRICCNIAQHSHDLFIVWHTGLSGQHFISSELISLNHSIAQSGSLMVL